MKRAILITTVLLAAIAWTIPASAVVVTYTVGGTGPMQFPAATPPPEGSPWGPNGYPGDTVELQGYTGTIDLVTGTHVLKINSLLWTIDYTYGGTETCWDYPACWSELSFPVNASRSFTLHTSNGTITQTGLLECNWDNDYIAFGGGSTLTFEISGVTVRVTPLPFARTGAFWGKPTALTAASPEGILCNIPCVQPPRDMFAQFVVEGTVATDTVTWKQVKELYR